MFSRFFIDRPIFSVVISILIVLAGLLAMRVLPIAQYPEIAPPVVTVRAVYPGASATVLEQTVAAPLENAINGIEDMMYMSSTSASNGVLEIQVTFEIGSDVDKAALNVNNRVKQAEARLPEEVRRQGVTVEKGSSAFLQVLAFLSPDGRYDDLYTSNYVTLNVLDRLKRIPGTTNVQIFGAKDYAMRIWLKPDRMAQLGVTVADLTRAINEQNAQFAPGKIGQPPVDNGQALVYSLTAKGRLADPKEFENIVVRANTDGSMLYLKDVARVELGSKDYDFAGLYNGKPATLVGIFLQPGANALEVGDEVIRTVEELKKKFPPGLDYAVPYDTTRFVEVSIREVVKTLGEAILLVVLVVFLFLQNWRATLIPVLAVPVSLLGTFVGLLLLGYSINTLTLFGMVLAIGIVVDDAIVVLENIERIIHEHKKTPREAALLAMREVTGPVIAIVLVLCAVFVPIAFLGGLTGELYRQFAATIAISVVISGLVALTLTPALCVALLKGEKPHEPGRFFRAFNRGFAGMTRHYQGGVKFLMRRSLVALSIYLLMIAAAVTLWKFTPGSLVPDEDQGYYISAVYLPDGSALSRTEAVVKQVDAIVRKDPAVQHVVAFAGLDFLGGGFRNSAATIFVAARHWDERKKTIQQMVGEMMGATSGIREALVLAFAPPPIFGLGNAGGFEFYIQNKGEGGPQKLSQVADAFLAAARQDKRLAQVLTLWRPHVPQLYVDVDREKAKMLGVKIDDVFTTLSATLGSYYVNDFNKYGRTWQVLMAAEPGARKTPQDVSALFVPNASGEMVPMSALAKISFSSGPETLDRYNNSQAVKIMGSAVPGVSSGQSLAIIDEIAKKVLPPDFSYEWTGASFQEKRSSGTSGIALGLAVLMVFLILAAQYEKWTLPFAVLMALPFGTFGALAAVWLRGLSNDVYFQIGLVTLLGLAAKNAILIVEFAVLKKQEGYSSVSAALEAARLRFRPILMTSLAFILGVLPLAISTGAGAGARHAVGTGVVGGMLAATFLAVFFIPLFFHWVSDRRLQAKTEEIDAHPHATRYDNVHLPSHHPSPASKPPEAS
ncbi:multidrug efflux RND transporter permease subunit [Thiobacillus sp.]|uniref:efflux RND transporter permease subunit n=1 Tax=Thiobacillus sp. TaxID=924 RepID=UPI0011D7023F|nr:multidrug efflux RND transporter permease subunit [Thiobacillus sp.]MBC2730137.1 multidrug efflux RND transporter permease subunit [Thiobacillus sp.]MBC2738875.1 multidrug efflux RND transporter permease subunit [Thiobacillus sp.]MBD3813307.1 multidrug efflux RND transporter permease subunit [Betaproteobacteria bacterium]TXH74543.1 MAG: multidrug efflux RND transporter permease subunit [Thiobacillus sp.]